MIDLDRERLRQSTPLLPILLNHIGILFLETDFSKETRFKASMSYVPPNMKIDTSFTIQRTIREFESERHWDWLITGGNLSFGENFERLEEYWAGEKAQRERRFPRGVVFTTFPGATNAKVLPMRWSRIFGPETLVLITPMSPRLPYQMGLKKEVRC